MGNKDKSCQSPRVGYEFINTRRHFIFAVAHSHSFSPWISQRFRSLICMRYLRWETSYLDICRYLCAIVLKVAQYFRESIYPRFPTTDKINRGIFQLGIKMLSKKKSPFGKNKKKTCSKNFRQKTLFGKFSKKKTVWNIFGKNRISSFTLWNSTKPWIIAVVTSEQLQLGANYRAYDWLRPVGAWSSINGIAGVISIYGVFYKCSLARSSASCL